MGFLDNSGDIILDAVLTDLGRERMARGDGSFKIAKYAAGDDEIDYGKYERNNVNGSAYYDLEILKTPILEAFTDNAGQLKSKLVTIPRNNLLYLPILKLVNGELNDGEITSENATLSDDNVMYVTVDLDTSTVKGTGGAASATKDLYTRKGVIRGDGIISTNKNTSMIVIDQGLNTVDLPQSSDLDLDLKETQYILKNIKKPNAAVDATAKTSVIAGPVGTRLLYALRASTELRSSNSLFDKLGSSKSGLTLDGITYSDTFRYIDTTVRVTGVTTGYRLDIPIRFIKKS